MKNIILITFIFYSKIIFAGATGEVLGETAKGAVVGGAVGMATTKAGQAIIGKEASESIGKFFDSPPGILTVSAIATVYSGTLYNAAAQQEEECEQNIKKLERTMKELGDSFDGFCPNGRNDLNEPNCYCYTDAGAENPNRTRSQICQELWAKNKFKFNSKAESYAGFSKFVDPVGCINIYGQFDENCNCKKFTDKKGQNACKKTMSVSIPNAMTGAMVTNTGINELLRFAANTANGNPKFNNFSNMGLGLKAISTQNLKDKILEKLKNKNSSGTFAPINENNIDKVAQAVFGEKTMNLAKSSSSSSFNIASNKQLDEKTENFIKNAAKKTGIDMIGSGSGLNNKKVDKKENFSFSLGDNTSSNNTGNVQEFSETKNYKIKNDISKNPDVSIFEIISNRYINSGLKRLFEEK